MHSLSKNGHRSTNGLFEPPYSTGSGISLNARDPTPNTLRELFAPNTFLMRVVHKMGIDWGRASRDSGNVVRRSACSWESGGAANMAERV